MISIDELTKEPIKLKKGMTTNPVLNKLLKTKNFGALINEIGGGSASVGMGQDLGGPGLETAVQTQPGTRPSGSYDNITKSTPVSRDYIRGGNLQLKNVTKKVPGVENVNIGKGPPFLEKYTTKGGKDYINNVVKYVQGMGDDISAKAVSGGSFKGANPEFDKIRKSLIEEAKTNKGILRTYFTETKKPNEGVLINGKRYTMKKEPLDKLFKKVSGYVGKEDTKNFVKLVDQEIVKQGGKLSGKSGLVKDFILNEAQRLFKLGDKKGAKIILTALATSIPTISKAATPLTVPLTTIDIIKLSEKFGPDIVEKIQSGLETVTEPVTSKIAEAQSMFENMLKSKMNQGGMMDINFMTRPLGYKDGTRGGTTVGDLEKNIPGGALETLREFAAPQVFKSMTGGQADMSLIGVASAFLRSIGASTDENSVDTVVKVLRDKIIPEEQQKVKDMMTSDLTKVVRGGLGLATKGKEKISEGIQSLMNMLKN
tara:strand:+ start:108 stop:1559 length:1452 start_codon:yes stop_codon:yes gene_type:complete